MKYYCKVKNCKREICEYNAHYGKGFCGSCWKIGRKLSKKTREKMRLAHLGNKNHFFGKHHTAYTKSITGQRGEKHWNWKGGINRLPYSFEFRKKLKEQILKRDSYKCKCCGITKKKHISLYGRTLQVHHIDYNKANNDINNLITLCNKCNTKANYNRDYWFAYYTYKIEIKEK